MKNIIERIAGGGAKIARYLPKAVSTRLLVLALGLGLTTTGWADLVAEWGPGDFPVSDAGSNANMTSAKGGLTLSKNNQGNTSTADYMMIATATPGGWPLTIRGMNYESLTVAIAYSLASSGDKDGAPISYTSGRGANIVYSYMESGAMYAGWSDGNNNKYGDLKVTTPADGTIHYLVFAYSKAGGTYMYYDGATSTSASGYYGSSGLKAGDSGTSSGNTTEIVLGAQRGPKQIINGMKVHYVAVYNSSLSSSDAATAYIAARYALGLATPVVDGSNNCMFNITGDLSYDVSSDTTYNSITFNVAEGKTLFLSGATLTGTNGITVNGGTVKLLTANTQLSGALGGTGTVAYPAGTLPSGVTYGENWTGTIWVKGLQGNAERNFDSYGQGTSKVKISGITGYLNSNPIITFNRELVLDDDTYGFAMKLGNGNSPAESGDNVNRCAIFKKLSGDGTFTAGGTTGGNGAYSWSIIRIIDSSEFTGSINCQVESGAQLGGVIFSVEDEEMPDTMYNMFSSNKQRIFVSAGRAAATGNAVTVPAGKTWTARGGVDVRGDLIVNGTLNAAIVNNTGSITVNPGATVSNQGSKRDFTGITIDSSVPVKITMTSEEYGKGSVSVTGANGISSITVLAPDGTTEVGTITPEAGEGSLETGVKVSGKACWIDYEMTYGNEKTGFENTGTSTLVLQKDSGIEGSNAFTDDGMLYTYAHPYRQDLTIPSTWTAVVRCTVPNYSDAAVITFGWNNNYIGLVAGETPRTEMRLVQYKSDYNHYITNAVMKVQDATTAQHVYIFAVENSQTLKVYCDGTQILNKVLDESLTITSGFQIGSVLGGVTGGIVRFAKGESAANTLAESVQKNARIDCVRLYDYSLSADQIAALSDEFPAVKLYEATVEADADTTWGALDWSNDWDGGNEYSKVLLTVEGDATVTLPESITAEELAFDVEPGSTLMLKGPGSLAVTRAIDAVGFTLKLDGTVTFATDTTFNGSVVFNQFTKAGDGAIKLSNGATVGVASGSVVVTPLGTYTLAEGTVVDSAYHPSGEGDVKLIPLTSAVVSITQGGTTLYYSDLDTAVTTLLTIGNVSDDVCCELLNGTTWPTTPSDYAGILRTMGYYIDGNGILTKAVARISSTPYQTLAAAVAAASDSATVTLLLNSSETITLNKAITLSETANFSGTLTGNGTLTFAAFRNNPSITFDNWTGTVVLPSFAADGTKLNNYGVAGSTIVLKGITGGWLGETSSQKMDVAPVLQLDGNVTIKGFSTSWDYTFAELAGTGNFVLDPTGSSPKSVAITKVAKGFTGIITNNTDKTLTIATLDREAGTQITGGMKLLTTSGSGDITASSLTVGGVAQGVTLCTESDGIYVVAASVHKGENTPTIHTTVAAAMTEAGSDAATITLLANTSSDIALAVGQSLVTDGFSVGTVSTGATYYHVVNNAGVYTVVLDTYTITIPSVANTTVSVSYTSGGEALFATAAGDITVDAGTDVTANWTAASGYKITSGASQTLNAVTSAQTLASPTVEAMGATVSDVNFSYGADYATATVTATVTGDATSATLSYGNTTYDANVVNGTVTFENVAVTRGNDIYAPADYTIAAKDGETAVTTTGGSGTTVAANVVAAGWINENAETSGTSAGGSWTNAEAVTYSEGKAAITDNRFEATTASTASRVVLEFNVCFSSVSASDVDGEAQAAIKIGEVESAATFMVLAPNSSWTPVSNADLTPDPAATYKVVLTIDYGTGSYGVTVGDNALTNATGSASFPLAASKTSVQTIDFAGSGTLTSMKGDQVEGYMVVDKNGTRYATISDAIAAYTADPTIGPLKVLHAGTAPSGWSIVSEGGIAIIKKLAKGFFFMAY